MATHRRRRRRDLARQAALQWPERFNRETCCRGKRAFPTFDIAYQELDRLKQASYFDGGEMNVYLCPEDPSHYHFGHVPGSGDRNVKVQETGRRAGQPFNGPRLSAGP